MSKFEMTKDLALSVTDALPIGIGVCLASHSAGKGVVVVNQVYTS